MLHPPVLTTERLVLRPFDMRDAAIVQQLAGAREIYETTLNVPHPYLDGMAERWIATHALTFYNGQGLTLAITLKGENRLIGAITMEANAAHARAELGYWIGTAFWNKGYCTEAVQELITYGFEVMHYHKIAACHAEFNPSSGRVLKKVGMKQEGIFVDNVLKDGQFITIVAYGLINPSAHG